MRVTDNPRSFTPATRGWCRRTTSPALRLIGCPDPNPTIADLRSPAGDVAVDLDVIGRRYIEALYAELRRWLLAQPATEPIGVPFSGGIDSGSVLLCLNALLLNENQSPARLKAFTLSVDGDGDDARQARDFLRRTNLEMLGETIDVHSRDLDPLRAVAVIEDYKPLDVECAAVNLALLANIRARYPEWRLLVDGDGGDENLKDYPIEANSELTIRVSSTTACSTRARASKPSSIRSRIRVATVAGAYAAMRARVSTGSSRSVRTRDRR